MEARYGDERHVPPQLAGSGAPGPLPPPAPPELLAPAEPLALLRLLQLCDSLFPTGAFAYSHGLETLVARRAVHNRATLGAWVAALLEHGVASADAVFAAAARRAADRGDLAALAALDAEAHAMRDARELREEGQLLARGTLRAARALAPADPWLAEYEAAVDAGATPGAHPVAFALAARALGVPAGWAVLGFLYSAASALVAAGVRLIPLGQREGQTLLARLAPQLARWAADAARREPSEAASFLPAVAIASMAHERLPSRLFRS